MRVLIVSGFGTDAAGKRKEAHFTKSIESALRKLKALDLRIRVRKQNDLHEFVPSASCSDEEAKIRLRTFDRLDMVFVDGDPKRLPWGAWSSGVFELVRMCFQTGKCLFAASFAMRVLLHVNATNTERIWVLNGDGKGGPLSDLEDIDTDDPDISEKVFLDHATGDAYRFSAKEGTWNPVFNVGLVKRIARKDKATQRFLDKDVRVHKDLYQHPKGYQELTVQVQKQHVQHWLFQGLAEKAFNIKYTCEWEARPVYDRVSPDGGANLNVLALEPITAAPCVIEYGHIIALASSVEKEYPETGKILENYIRAKHDLIVKHDRLEYMTQEQFQACLKAESFVNVLDPERSLKRQTAHIVPPIKTHDLRASMQEVAPASARDRLDDTPSTGTSRPTPQTRSSSRSRSALSSRHKSQTSLRVPLPKERVTAKAHLQKESLGMTTRSVFKSKELLDGGGGAAADFYRMLSTQKRQTAEETAMANVPRKRPTSAMPLTTARGTETARGYKGDVFVPEKKTRRPASARKQERPKTPVMQSMSIREAFASVSKTKVNGSPSYMQATESSTRRSTPSPSPSPSPSSNNSRHTSRSPSPLAWSQAGVRRALNKGRAANDRHHALDSTKRIIKVLENPDTARVKRKIKEYENKRAELAKARGTGSAAVWQSKDDKEREERILNRALRVGPAWFNPGKATELARFNETTSYTKSLPAASGPYEPPALHHFRGKEDKSKFTDPKGFIVAGPRKSALFDEMR